jgi:hypothetical protein
MEMEIELHMFLISILEVSFQLLVSAVLTLVPIGRAGFD